jgi:serine phosphatase RsbU (regulator of sigma subunit)
LFLLFIPANAIFLATRAAKTRQLLESLTRTLEDRVLERTEELAQTLSKVSELKIAQDCDYFLTSRLYRPLAQLSAVPEHCKIEGHIEQYKKFTFRKWSEELGGDILITADLTLDAHSRIALLAGDAMGKSMQGAGGAIVLGSVFHSILDRTRISLSARHYQPEKWLIATIHLLHTVFLSFNGSMLMSIFLAIYDEKTRKLHFINADHPQAALLRQGRASFLPGAIHRKLGIELQLPFQVSEIQLQQGDVVYLGSDGRDNISLHEQKSNERQINEDPELFLQSLEQSKGDMKQLIKAIKAKGQLIDDLSLLRLEIF